MNKSLLAIAAIFTLLLVNSSASAQNEEDNTGYDNYYDYEANPDSLVTPEGGEGGYDEYDPGGEDKPKKPEKKPYVRITMPYDTITELITYTGVVEQQDSYYDSLYLRAKRYLTDKFKLKEKDFKETAVNMDKIIMTLQLPYLMHRNKHVTEEVGKLEFKLAMRFKDGKYKYDIDHLKHNMPLEAAGTSTPQYIYLEYYMRAEKSIIQNDQLLRAADRSINKLIDEIKKALKEPVIIDEDDW